MKHVNRAGVGKPRGFTLIETIAVLVLIGILSAFILINTNDIEKADVYAQSEAIKSHLRFVQTLAMTSNTPHGLRLLSASSYELYRINKSTGNPETIPSPDGESPVNLPSGVSLSVQSSDYISYDDWGIPYQDEDGTTPQATADRTVTVAMSGLSRSFTIRRNTGFIE